MPWCALAIEDAGDHGVGIEGRQPAHERDRILIGAYRGRPRARQRQINLSERAALPAQGEARRGLVALDFDNDFLEQRPQQLLPVARRRGRGVPNGGQISSEREQTTAPSWESARGRASSRRESSALAALSALRRLRMIKDVIIRKIPRKGGSLDRSVKQRWDKGYYHIHPARPSWSLGGASSAHCTRRVSR